MQIKVGDTIYHEDRYWKLDGLRPDEVPGWNAEYVPYRVVRVTEKTIYAEWRGNSVQLPRQKRPQKPKHAPHETLEADGRQYHSRFHGYFYTAIPKHEQPRVGFQPQTDAATLLGLRAPYSADDVKRAFKRLARTTHPDGGGSHEGSISLKRAHDEALKGVGMLSVSQGVSGLWRCSCGATMDFRVSGSLGDLGAHLLETFLSQHKTTGHRVTKTA